MTKGQRNWKSIPFAPDYEVSDYGEVRRVVQPSKGPRIRGDGILEQHCDKDGYKIVICFNKGQRVKLRIATLVCSLFNGPKPFDGAVCTHEDGNNWNNRAENLKWKTQFDNIQDKRKHGTVACGERAGSSKLTTDVVKQIRSECFSGKGFYAEMGRKYAITPQQIRNIYLRRQWAHVD